MSINVMRALFAIAASVLLHAVIGALVGGADNAWLGLALFAACWFLSGRIISKDLDKAP